MLGPVHDGMFNSLKKSAMKVSGKLLDSANHVRPGTLTEMTIRGTSAGIALAVYFSEETLCINPEEVQLSIASYLLGMFSESVYYAGANIIGQNYMYLLELLQIASGTDIEYNYAINNLDASAYYYGKALVDDAYASLGEMMTSPLTLLAGLLGALGSSGGGSVSYGAAGGATAGIELESGIALSSGVVIAVSVATGSNMQSTGNARGEENREKAKQAAKGDSKAPDNINYDSKQVGKKYGEHMKDYPDMKDYTEYKDYADEIFKSPDQIIHDVKNGEYYYTKGDDLLRIKENGDFVSLYPGVDSGRVTDAINNGGVIWP